MAQGALEHCRMLTHRIAFCAGMFEYSNMRLTCKSWKRELDLCTDLVEPAIADTERIVRLFPNVNKIDLSVCNLTVHDEDLERLPKLKNLKVLDLRGCAAVSSAATWTLSVSLFTQRIFS